MTTAASQPADEVNRLASLHRYAILDSDPEPSFDRIVSLASRQFRVPTALISLVDADRQWFKASCGFTGSETDRDIAFCSHAILDSRVLVIPDTLKDDRFKTNPLVTGDPKIRFYAGAPLITPQGHKLGTLCLIDTKPRRSFSARNQLLLKEMAAVVSDLIELHYATGDVVGEVASRLDAEHSLAESEHLLKLFFEHAPVAVAMFDTDLRFLAASQQWCDVFSMDASVDIGRSQADVLPHLPVSWGDEYQRCLKGEALDFEEQRLPRASGGFHWIRRHLRPWRDCSGAICGLISFVEIVDERKAAQDALQDSQTFMQAVLDNIEDGLVACDADGRITMFNEALRRMHGNDGAPHDPDQWAASYNLYETDGLTLLPTEEIPLFRALNDQPVTRQEVTIVTESEKELRLLASATPLYDHKGQKLGAVASLHDVTNERAAEARWRKTHALYQAVFDNTFQFCGLLSPEGIVLEANQTVLEFSGIAKEEAIGMPFWNAKWWRLPEPHLDVLRESIDQARNGAFVRYEIEVHGKDGVATPVDFSIKPILDPNGNTIMLIAEGRDISEKRKSEIELRRKQSELELIFNNVPIRIFFKDDANRIVRLNEQAARSMGGTVGDFEGADTYELFPDMAKKYHDEDLEVINAGKPRLGIVEEYTPRDSEHGWVKTDKVPYTDPETGQQYLFVAASDITSEKDALDALQDSEERYRLLYTKTPVMLQSIDRTARILSVSDFWLERMGYSREEVIGRQAGEFFTSESLQKLRQESWPALLMSGRSDGLEYQMVCKSGEVFDVLASAVAEVDGSDTSDRIMIVMTDVTQRKAMEQQFLQAQKMESVGQLTGGLAHDFNNLLGVVLGNLQLLERVVEADEKSSKRISSAIAAVEKGAELTRRLLAFSRRQSLETELVLVNPLIENLGAMLRRTLGETIDLEYRLSSEIPSVETDPTQLESSLLNLAINARDAMPDGGTLMIESEYVHLDADFAGRNGDLVEGDYVVVAVTDTGCGIPREMIDQVFEPFFTTKDVGKGSGLGLSMIYGFIRQSGGRVGIYSEVGLGTTVRIYLPAKYATGPSADMTSVVSNDVVGGSEKILVVEDQHDVREVAVSLLEDLGYEVTAAESARAALAILKEDPTIDLLFTDIVMPGGIDGITLAKAAAHVRSDMPVVFTTGYAEAAILRDGEVRTSSNLVTKPYRRPDLASKIRSALDGKHTDQTALPASIELEAIK